MWRVIKMWSDINACQAQDGSTRHFSRHCLTLDQELPQKAHERERDQKPAAQ
ncbi:MULTISPECIES: hypothetical protein [Acetobacter]|uniref:Uncharacterized protein n=1 Tax=Komagataeibacter saccharivorans TaxID=265959 RepID=A0A347W7S3_9PROT|nr:MULTISPECIES: hypothetical protein [Acetobacter]ARW15256.1 hypothetical protein S101446_00115 [Komagataeibacter europaeus]AXY20916.1 hypothetical protein CD178_00080 [Komagataeibacter saccharivorans]SAY47985.1 hypothetical protein KRIGEM_00930 [Komagataeibacter rhaeticus]